MKSEDRPQRVRVTSPRTSAARTRPVSIASEIDAQTRLGEVYIDSLIRSQLRLGLGITVVLAVTLGGLPLLFHIFPALGRVEILGLPLPWILLTIPAFALILLLGRLHVRYAERNEDSFSELLEHR